MNNFDGVSALEHKSKCVKVHGIMASLSPMKESSSGSARYFDGKLNDGKTSCRVVGFDTKQQQRCEEFREKKEAMSLVNCKDRSSKWGPQLEVTMHGNTEVQKSPTTFDVATLVTSASTEIGLDQLQGLQNYQKVTVRVKVVSVKEESEAQGGLRMQDYIIGDATGAAKLTVWERNVGIFKEGSSCKLSGLKVQMYNGKKFLSMPRENCEIAGIDDTGDVEKELGDDENKLEDAIVGVMLLNTYSNCFSCKGKVAVTGGTLGKCSKCNITLHADKCTQEMSAKLVVEGGQKEKKAMCKNLSIFSSILKKICQGTDVTEDNLLTADPFDAVFSEKNVITGISRKVCGVDTAT